MSKLSNVALVATLAAASVATTAAPTLAQDGMVYVCGVYSDLNVRAWPGTNAPVLHRLDPGEALMETGDYRGNWTQVITPEGAGYVHHDYLCH